MKDSKRAIYVQQVTAGFCCCIGEPANIKAERVFFYLKQDPQEPLPSSSIELLSTLVVPSSGCSFMLLEIKDEVFALGEFKNIEGLLFKESGLDSSQYLMTYYPVIDKIAAERRFACFFLEKKTIQCSVRKLQENNIYLDRIICSWTGYLNWSMRLDHEAAVIGCEGDFLTIMVFNTGKITLLKRFATQTENKVQLNSKINRTLLRIRKSNSKIQCYWTGPSTPEWFNVVQSMVGEIGLQFSELNKQDVVVEDKDLDKERPFAEAALTFNLDNHRRETPSNQYFCFKKPSIKYKTYSILLLSLSVVSAAILGYALNMGVIYDDTYTSKIEETKRQISTLEQQKPDKAVFFMNNRGSASTLHQDLIFFSQITGVQVWVDSATFTPDEVKVEGTALRYSDVTRWANSIRKRESYYSIYFKTGSDNINMSENKFLKKTTTPVTGSWSPGSIEHAEAFKSKKLLLQKKRTATTTDTDHVRFNLIAKRKK